ncbi:VOC family protein [Oligoflexaceae bacterium]|nr:VOC family protein [Oligoflexaceae bacterium]
MTKAIPENSAGFLPYLIVRNASEAIDFYCKAFGGKAGTCLKMKNGDVGHAEVIIGNTTVMLSEEKEEWGIKGPLTLGSCPITLTLYVKDVEHSFKKAVDAGMIIKKEIEDHFFGDRMGRLTDPYGYEWCIGTHIEDVSEQEMQKRMNELYG